MSALVASNAALTARSVSRSHVGRVRQVNEDRVLDAPECGLWAVCDGMGGHRGGDLAAQAVVDALRQLCGTGASPVPDAVIAALDQGNAEIFERDRGTGSTAVVLSLHDGHAELAWAGDSRCYRLRDGVLEQLTHDHSVVQELIDAGLISVEAAATHPQSNVITRALGVSQRCEFDRCRVDIKPRDRYLLCSDGLSRTLRDKDFADIAIEALAEQLIGNAMDRDGTDNISAVLVEFV